MLDIGLAGSKSCQEVLRSSDWVLDIACLAQSLHSSRDKTLVTILVSQWFHSIGEIFTHNIVEENYNQSKHDVTVVRFSWRQ